MKTLQNNFTTPEQSKRLLELGVPADSTDCYLIKCRYGFDTFHPHILNSVLYSELDKFTNMLYYMPCWSVGRLIDIFRICHNDTASLILQDCTIEYLVGALSCQVKLNHLDFSKLEE